MSDLPDTWIQEKLGTLCNLNYGKNLPIKEFTKSGFPVFGANGQIGFYSSYHYEKSQLLITCRGATCGSITRSLPQSFVTNNSIVISPKSSMILDTYFLEFFLKREDNSSVITGSAQPQITLENLEKFVVSLPPIAEQKRIVTKLDSLFAHTCLARQELDHIPKLIERYKQAILSAAFRGDLTADWRKENNQDIAKTWKLQTLDELIINKPKNGYSVKPVKHQTPFRVLTLTATTSGKFNSEHFKYFDEPIDIDSQFWLQPDDILIQRGNTIEYVGVPAIYDGLPNQFIFPDLMIRVRANSKTITKFLYIALSCEKSRNYLRDKATGTAGTMPKINQPTLISLPISLPSLDEQKEIVKRVENYFQAIDRLEQEYQKAMKFLDRLEQSTLAKAFRGELVPQDPNDEPASLLLERIQKERENQQKPKKRQLSLFK